MTDPRRTNEKKASPRVTDDYELTDEDCAELMDGVPDMNDPPAKDDPDIPF